MSLQIFKTGSSNRVDRFALYWAEVILKYRWLTIIISLSLCAVLTAGITKLDVSNNYRVFFSDNNPDLKKFEQFEATYSKNDNFLIVIKPKEGEIDNASVMSVVEALTQESWSIPYASRVDSLTNFQHTFAQEDELIVENLIESAKELSANELTKRINIALSEPLLKGRLIALDKKATGINITLQYPNIKLSEVPESLNYTRELVNKFKSDNPNIDFAITGVSALNGAFAEATVTDAKTLFGPMFLLLVFITWLIFRSISATIATVIVINLATMVAMGVAGWTGLTVSPFSGSAPVVILTLAIADSIHILMTVMQRLKYGDNKIAAVTESIKVNFLAVSITSLTTIIGFLALNFSDAPPFNVLGNISAVGIATAWLLSLTLFPVMLTLLPLTVKKSAQHKQQNNSLLQQLVMKVTEFVIKHTKKTLVISTLVTIALLSAIPMINLDDQWIEYFDHRVEFRGDAEFARDNLTGLYLLEYSVPSGKAGGISEPEYLHRLAQFTQWLREQHQVRHVYSYSDIIKRLNKNMHGDNQAYYRLTDNRELAAQYLLLYEMSLPFGLDTNDRIDIDKSSTRVTITLDDITTKETRHFLTEIDNWWQANNRQNQGYATGATYLFSFISERNIIDMIGGNLVAVCLIAIIMMFTLQSIRYGLLSLIPNIAPLIITFGLWSLLVGQVGMAAATVSATSLGIIVDNTVHLLTKYLRALTEQKLTTEDAVRYAYHTVGTAVAANAIILTIGFSVLALSSFKITAEMGILTSLAILVALIVDFFLLPSILLTRPNTQTSGEDHENILTQQAA
ncbi:RND transporter [Thalassotalea insulae]|uniref:RND transporter n=1 Tax=Thalassotalea insulae TaxID=2056778 RepID=A0ABQ6GXL2_9GAMM|nr:MMPL family transporter [Thalassotalea insulae]GLX79929.1 RND transporter [Thalassotalea insulae]